MKAMLLADPFFCLIYIKKPLPITKPKSKSFDLMQLW